MQGPTTGETDNTGIREYKGSWSQHGDHQHGVQFYSQDKFLLEELSEYIGSALRAGQAAVVVATDAHRNGLLQWLTAQRLDVAALLEQGRLVVTDAEQLLTTFMQDGWPDEDRFNHVVGGIVAKAQACSSGTQPRVAIFGEMVALLWADGKADAAIRLEQLWNRLAATYEIDILCGYALSSLHGREDERVFLSI